MKSFLVVGLGRFGKSCAKTLFEMGYEVMGVDRDEVLIQEFSNFLTYGVAIETISEEFLRSIDIKRFDAVIVAIGAHMEANIMTTLLAKELKAKFILSKAQDEFQSKLLYRIGADKVVCPEKDMGRKAASSVAFENFSDMLEISNDFSVIKIQAPDAWVGKNVEDLDLSARHGLNILAIKHVSEENVEIPTVLSLIQRNDVLAVMGSNSDLKRIYNSK